MKNITVLFGAFLTLFLISCEGDPGPPGPPGFDGNNGLDGAPGIQAQLFEVEGVNFGYVAENNLWEAILPFGDFTSFVVEPNDAVLVYQFDRVQDFDNSDSENVWNLIPQSFFLEEGTIQYTSGHTTQDAEVLISGNFDLANLDVGFTDDQIFRIAILPGVAAESKMDRSNIASVMSSLGLEEKDVLKFKAN